MSEDIKKFYRSRSNRIIFGVCGGLGDYFKIDPILFRLLFVLLIFIDGAGIPLYIIMTIITPEEPGRDEKEGGLEGEVKELADKIDQKAKELQSEKKAIVSEKKEDSGSRYLLGVLIVIFGVFFLMREMFPMFWISNNALGAMAIIAIGLLILFKK